MSKNLQTESNFSKRYQAINDYFNKSIDEANTLIGVPDNTKVNSPSGLLQALTYEMDITFKMKKGALEGELGLQIPEEIPETAILSQNRISKVKSRLATAAENKQEFDNMILEQARKLELQYPGYRLSDYIKTTKSLYVFEEFDCIDYDNAPIQNLLNGFKKTDQVKFVLFVCPPVDYTYLQSSLPEDYIRTSTSISLLKEQISRISQLAQTLVQVDVNNSVDIFIGDDDDEKYIAINTIYKNIFSSLDENETNTRKIEFLQNVQDFLKSKGIPFTNIQNLSSIDYIPDYSALDQFTEQDFQEEMSRMRELWRPNSYYTGLPSPEDDELKSMVEAKFATYAAQGVLLKSQDQNGILLQTERPPRLRTKMINASLPNDQKIPALYLFNK